MIRLAALALALAGVVAGCDPEAESVPPILGAVFPPTGDLRPLPVTVDDRTGLIRLILVADSDGGARDGVSMVPERPTALRLQWTGGMCDRRVLVLFDRNGGRFELTVTTQGANACRLAGVFRVVILDLAEPIDPTSITLAVDYRPVGP